MILTKEEMSNFKRLVKFVNSLSEDPLDLYIGQGKTRDVYALSERFVLKVQDNESGHVDEHGGNREEFEHYKIFSDEAKECAAKPFFITKNDKFMIMERMLVTIEDMCSEEVDWDRAWEVEEALSDFGVSDMHTSNIMINESGEYKVVDYAAAYGCSYTDQY